MASRSSWGSLPLPRSVSEFLARPIAASVAIMLLALAGGSYFLRNVGPIGP
jgi:hypothetical protein